MCYGLNCVPWKLLRWNPNPQCLRMSPYLEIDHCRRDSLHEVIRVDSNPMWLVSIATGGIWRDGQTRRENDMKRHGEHMVIYDPRGEPWKDPPSWSFKGTNPTDRVNLTPELWENPLLLLNPASLSHFVAAALANWYTISYVLENRKNMVWIEQIC